MTRFFVPDTPRGAQTDRAYEDLRRHAEFVSGRIVRQRRIFMLSRRFAGSDLETRVGEETVYAIFDVGDAYTILTPGEFEIVPKRQTYTAIEFE